VEPDTGTATLDAAVPSAGCGLAAVMGSAACTSHPELYFPYAHSGHSHQTLCGTDGDPVQRLSHQAYSGGAAVAGGSMAPVHAVRGRPRSYHPRLLLGAMADW